jgi:hypothetical protein
MLDLRNYIPALRLGAITPAFQSIAVNTTGTTPVNVFADGVPANLAPGITITSVVSTALDTTAGNITVANAGNTVATIAKGTAAGALVGATSLANASVTSGAALTVVSSSAGNSTVVINFKLGQSS